MNVSITLPPCDEFGARALAAGRLPADAGAVEQQREGVGQHFRLRDAGAAAQRRQAVALLDLQFLDQASRRMAVLGQFDRGIGEIAAPVVGRQALRRADRATTATAPAMSPGFFALDVLPDRVGLRRDAAQIGDDQIVLRIEVPVERHLVGAGGLGDGLDTDAANAVTMEQLAGRQQDSLARPQ